MIVAMKKQLLVWWLTLGIMGGGISVSIVKADDVFEGITGLWLTNGVAEAFVSGKPYPRVVAFRRKGSDSPFRRSTRDQFYGIRTWFLEPVQLKTAPLPAMQPAEVRRVDDHTAVMSAAPEPQTGLQVTMECRLDRKDPVLEIRHGLKNTATEDRRFAAWSIMAFPHAGVGCVPWATEPTTVRSALVFPKVDPTEPSLAIDAAGMAVDYRVPIKGGHVKVGTNSDTGWAAYLWDNQAILSRVPWVAGAEYPEGGGTVTLFSTGRTMEAGFCELEHVGPLTEVESGQVLWLNQTMKLLSEVKPETENPAGWLNAVKEKE